MKKLPGFSRHRALLIFVFWSSLLMCSIPSWSAVNQVDTTPTTANVAIGRASSVSFVWRVFNTNNAPQTVSSASGTFRDSINGNTILGTINSPLTATANNFCGGFPSACLPVTVVVNFSETIVIPTDVVARALQMGLGSIVYQRSFTPTGTSSTAAITLNITSSSAANFNISGEILSFDNGSSVRILPRNNAIHAQAELGYNGTGLLQAVWEIAEPATTSGTPVFRPLTQVREYLTLGDTKTLKSPALPTGAVGLYLIRLRVIDPIVPFTMPVIRYFVAEGRVGKELPPDPVGVTSPVPFALYAPDTLFAWETHKGTKAYQLEVYRTDRNPATELPDLGGGDRTPKPSDVAAALRYAPVTGMLVPGSQTTTTLSANARQRLIPGRAYLWRVLAISEDGTVIGQSPMREMRTP